MTQETKHTLIGALFAVSCLLLYFFYPVGNTKFEIFASIFIFLVGLPLLYNRIVWRNNFTDLGMSRFTLSKNEMFLLLSSVIVGGLVGFFFVSMKFDIERYVASLSPTILQDFRAFAIYELVFSSAALLLFSFFAWGFVRTIPWHREVYATTFSLIVYGILLMDFYSGFFIVIPLLMPAFFLLKSEKKVNPLYIFLACYVIGLILDTVIVKSFATSL